MRPILNLCSLSQSPSLASLMSPFCFRSRKFGFHLELRRPDSPPPAGPPPYRRRIRPRKFDSLKRFCGFFFPRSRLAETFRPCKNLNGLLHDGENLVLILPIQHHRPFKYVSTRLFSTKNHGIAQAPPNQASPAQLVCSITTKVLLQFDTFSGSIHHKTATLNQLSGTDPPPSLGPRSASAVLVITKSDTGKRSRCGNDDRRRSAF